jgi:hypothetical protein
VQVTCAQCGEAFEGKRRTAKYCSPTCRQRSRRRATPAETEAALDLELGGGIVAMTRRELTSLKKLDSVVGQQAMTLAIRMTSGKETGSAIAALSRELTRVLQLARAAGEVKDPVDEVRERREQKRARARTSSG